MALLRSATGIIAALTVIAYFIQHYLFGPVESAILGGFIPARISGMVVLESAVPATLTPFSATLLHGNVMHLVLNMVMLVYCGLALERVFGAPRLVILYLVGAVTAAAAQWFVDPAAALPMIGASGAVSALIGSFALGFGMPKSLVSNVRLNRALNAAWLLVAWVGLQYALDLLGAMEGQLIATPAHIGGFIAGMVLFPWLSAASRRAMRPRPVETDDAI